MAIINPKLVGDITYTQEPFWRVTTLPIKASTSVTKGKLVSIDAEGRLVAIASTANGIATVTNGMFQPLSDATAGTVEDADFVQVVTMGSRMLFKAAAGITVGNYVDVFVPAASQLLLPDKVIKTTTRVDVDRVGTVFEIYTRDTTTEQKKQKTADDDLVIVETGMF